MITRILPILILLLAHIGAAAEVPKSPYIAIVYRYADALVKNNRDAHRFAENDLRILYILRELSNKPIYSDAADAQLKWHLENSAIPSSRPWMLWDRCFEISPNQSKNLAAKSSSMRALAAAYQHQPDETYLKLIEVALGDLPKPASSAVDELSTAIEAWGASTRLPEPLARKLRDFAVAQDQKFLSRSNPLGANLWQTSNPPTVAALAMLCVSRCENTGNIKFRDLIHTAADAYRANPPTNEADISPMVFGHAISLELAAWRSAAKQEYLDSARKLADIAIKKFWLENDPLPRTAAGANADTLVLSLLELHLSVLHITAVRCPPNTIDR